MVKIKRKSKVFICALLIFTLLTLQVGHVKRAEAFAITGTIVAASLLATGAIYLGYLTLTGAEVKLPRENVAEYVTSIGDKITQYGTGAGIYATVYNYLFNNGVESLNSLNIDLDADSLLDLYNNSKDIAQIQNICSFTQSVLEDYTVTTDYDYDFTIVPAGEIVGTNNGSTTLTNLLATHTFTNWFRRVPAIVRVAGTYWNWYIYVDSALYYRNILKTNGFYGVQISNDNVNWRDATYAYEGFEDTNHGWLYIANFGSSSGLFYSTNIYLTQSNIANRDYPLLTNSPIYIQSTGEIIETVQNENGVYVPSPEWPNNHDDDNNKYPIVPYVELPTSQPGNYVPSKWGVNVGDLLDTLDDLADDLVTVGTIGELINSFKDSLVGTDTYNDYEYYNDNDYTYNYYYNNVIQNDNDYNINQNIEKDEYNMPVDMNNIRLVTDNDYIDALHSDMTDFAESGADMLALWHNSDYLTLYIVLGSAIFLLVCALIGKMGK